MRARAVALAWVIVGNTALIVGIAALVNGNLVGLFPLLMGLVCTCCWGSDLVRGTA